MTDEELMTRCAQANVLDAGELVKTLRGRYVEEIKAYVQRHFPLLWNSVYDVGQHAFLNIFDCRAQYRGGNFRAWLYTIVRRVALRRIALEAKWNRTGKPCEDVDVAAPEDNAIRDKVRAALDRLPERHRRMADALLEHNGKCSTAAAAVGMNHRVFRRELQKAMRWALEPV